MTDSAPADIARSWDSYWQSASTQPAYAGEAAGQPALVAFWVDYLAATRKRFASPCILDIASGNGAVVAQVFEASAGTDPDITCLDISESALAALQSRFQSAKTLQANADDIPLATASVDIVTSQFGIEYASTAAFAEVRRLLRTDGDAAFLLHHQGGVIADQCRRNRDAVERLQSARFIPRCIDMFGAGFAMLKGGDKAAYATAGRALAPAITAAEKIIADFGPEVANGTLLKLYRDVRSIHGRMQHHHPADVMRWLESMRSEMEAYSGRMSHMLDAALSAEDFDKLRADFSGAGFTERLAGPLVPPDHSLPLAWQFVVTKVA